MPFTVSTERIGWPRRRWWHPFTAVLGEYQGRLRYELCPDMPTATCHLQPSEHEPALCGHPWELLVPIPGDPDWTELHPEMRCEDCLEAAGLEREDASNRSYRYWWPER